jgi:hypothetical protein
MTNFSFILDSWIRHWESNLPSLNKTGPLLESLKAVDQRNLRQRSSRAFAEYVEEQAYRFNERKGKDQDRFIGGLKSVSGKRLTYSQLTGLQSEGH